MIRKSPKQTSLKKPKRKLLSFVHDKTINEIFKNEIKRERNREKEREGEREMVVIRKNRF